jgi:hypothetical protein
VRHERELRHEPASSGKAEARIKTRESLLWKLKRKVDMAELKQTYSWTKAWRKHYVSGGARNVMSALVQLSLPDVCFSSAKSVLRERRSAHCQADLAELKQTFSGTKATSDIGERRHAAALTTSAMSDD